MNGPGELTIPGDASIQELIELARAEPGATRVERFRDRIAAQGQAAVGPMSELKNDEQLPFFAAVVLKRLADGGISEATEALRDFASSAEDAELRRFAARFCPPTKPLGPAATPDRPAKSDDCWPSARQSPFRWELERLLVQIGADIVYHWTPLECIGSIVRHGVLSPSLLDRRRISYQPHGYGHRDKAEILREYVGLSFRTKPWMMDEKSASPVVIAIDVAALTADGTLFLGGNSASSSFQVENIRRATGPEALAALRFNRRFLPQSEAWVRDRIPPSLIRSLHVRDDALATAVGRVIHGSSEGSSRLPVLVSPELFVPAGSAQWLKRINEDAS